MKKFVYLISGFVLICGVVYSISSTESDEPSAESVFNSPQYSKAGIANWAIIEQVMGFPFDLDGIDEKNAALIRGTYSTYLGAMGIAISRCYEAGDLASGRREEFLEKLIRENYAKMKNLPLQGTMNGQAFASKEPEVDTIPLMAVFMICSQFQYIPDIVPFLECANIYVGDTYLAFGYRGYIAGWSQVITQPDHPLPPEKRLHFWPAAHAILTNPGISLPLLRDTVIRRDLRNDIRLRAASFINTLDPEYINPEWLSECEESIREQVLCIKEKGLNWRYIWRYPSIDPCDPDEEFKQDERLRQLMKLPADVNVRELRKQMEENDWGPY
ncbi:MAG: hypothetical protein ACE15F_21305 [bacterium]